MRLILTRHGRTPQNEMGIIQGHMDTVLSEEGISQAKRLSERLKKEKISAIYSSDLKRAVQTAEIIAENHPNLKPQAIRDFREVDFGRLDGKHKSEADWKNPPPDMESRKSSMARAKKVLDWLYERHRNQTVVLVGHGGINRAMISVIFGRDEEHMNSLPGQYNTAVNIFDIEEDSNHKVHLMNCVEHLGGEKNYLKKTGTERKVI